MKFSKYFDHTVLKADATSIEVDSICNEAICYDFASVCVNSYYTGFVAKELNGTGIDVCTVVGFPLGAMSSKAKGAETLYSIISGATEIDMVINVGALKEERYDVVLEDIKEVRKICNCEWKEEFVPAEKFGIFSERNTKNKVELKVILETCLLTKEEIVKACEIAVEAGADYVKTSTGFSTNGATVEDVKLMRKTVGNNAMVKASGGIRDLETALAMIEAGANRLGTSATVNIAKELEERNA